MKRKKRKRDWNNANISKPADCFQRGEKGSSGYTDSVDQGSILVKERQIFTLDEIMEEEPAWNCLPEGAAADLNLPDKEICGKIPEGQNKGAADKSDKVIWNQNVSEPYECFENSDHKNYGEMKNEPDGSAGDESGKGVWEQHISSRYDCFQPKDDTDIQSGNPGLPKREPVNKQTGEPKKSVQENQAIKRSEAEGKPGIKVITDNLIRQELFICINGRKLFMSENGEFIYISLSLESEIMYLKVLFRKLDMNLSLADYKAILSELKTEPDIWVKSLEKNKDGYYDISFCGGKMLFGVKGQFGDFAVRGQIQNKLKPFTEGIQLFVDECCNIARDARTGSTALFCAYKNFIDEYPDFLVAKQNQFIPYIKEVFGLHGGSTGKLRVVIGICLKEAEE